MVCRYLDTSAQRKECSKANTLLLLALSPFLLAELRLELESLMALDLTLDQLFRRDTLFPQSVDLFVRQKIRLADLGVVDKFVRLFDVVWADQPFAEPSHRWADETWTYRQQPQ